MITAAVNGVKEREIPFARRRIFAPVSIELDGAVGTVDNTSLRRKKCYVF
jgi:hypothetical protein